MKLADQANDDGVCWPSKRTLARDLEVTDRSIVKWARMLQEIGLLEIRERRRENGSQASNLYILNMGGEPPFTP